MRCSRCWAAPTSRREYLQAVQSETLDKALSALVGTRATGSIHRHIGGVWLTHLRHTPQFDTGGVSIGRMVSA